MNHGSEKERHAMNGFCDVSGCTNRKGDGEFVGDVCRPCYLWQTQGKGTHSQAYRNHRQQGIGDSTFAATVAAVERMKAKAAM